MLASRTAPEGSWRARLPGAFHLGSGDSFDIRLPEPEPVFAPNLDLLVDLSGVFPSFEGEGQIALLPEHLGDFLI
jgi:hypothetical protein